MAVNSAMLRAMQKARYNDKNLGHYGLALANYVHFTSPIRRYPDLAIHRILSAFCMGRAPGRNQPALRVLRRGGGKAVERR